MYGLSSFSLYKSLNDACTPYILNWKRLAEHCTTEGGGGTLRTVNTLWRREGHVFRC